MRSDYPSPAREPGQTNPRSIWVNAQSFGRRAFQIQGEEVFEELVVGEGGVPVVGGEDGGVEAAVGQVEPGGALVVEIRERALGEVLGALGVAGDLPWIADRGDSSLSASHRIRSHPPEQRGEEIRSTFSSQPTINAPRAKLCKS